MAFPLALAAAIPGLISSGYKIGSGIKQAKDGKEMAAANIFQKYNRPGEVDQALALAEQRYRNGTMPGSELMQNRLATSAAAAYDASAQGATSGGDVLDAATKINFNTNTAMNDLALSEAQYKDRALAGYTDQLNNSARYADKEFQYNVANPYERTAAAASALIGAGNQNVFNGVDEGMGVAASAIGAMDGGEGKTMGEKMRNPEVAMAEMAGVNQLSGGAMPNTYPVPGSPFVSQPTAGFEKKSAFSNPALMGKWIVDPVTGAKRWAAN